jgi:molecular chaperone GrpE
MNREETPDSNTSSEPTAHELDADSLKSQESTEGSAEAVDESIKVDDALADSDSAQAKDDEVGGETSELEAAHAEIAKHKDAFLRAKAEEDNVRRRAEKDIANSRKFAIEGFAKELLNVFDSLKLATAVELADDASETAKSVREGVEITLKQVNSAFAKFAVKEIAPQVGDKLDPNLHQAMSMVESEEVESGCIITVIQAGFELHERLLRPAMVVVAK